MNTTELDFLVGVDQTTFASIVVGTPITADDGHDAVDKPKPLPQAHKDRAHGKPTHYHTCLECYRRYPGYASRLACNEPNESLCGSCLAGRFVKVRWK